MIQLGKIQNLKVLRVASIGVYLGEDYDPLDVFARKTTGNKSSLKDTPDLLLPKNEYKSTPEVGSTLKVFVYKDSEDRPIATMRYPSLQVGEFALLTVRQVTNIGAFLDWGLPKDLLLPYREQTAELHEGDKVLVTLYVDKSSRLCASMKLYKKLRTDGSFEKGEWVKGHIYEISDTYGAYVAVDDKYSGMIPKKTITAPVKIGALVKARVVKILPDGKLELSLHEETHKEIFDDCDKVLRALEANGGFLPYHDKSSPEDIREFFAMTKNEFKRAIGHLYKEGNITIGEDGIRAKSRED